MDLSLLFRCILHSSSSILHCDPLAQAHFINNLHFAMAQMSLGITLLLLLLHPETGLISYFQVFFCVILFFFAVHAIDDEPE